MAFYEHVTEFAGLPVVDFPSPDIERERLRTLRDRARREGSPVPERLGPAPGDAYAAALADPGSVAWRLRVAAWEPQEPFQEHLARFVAEVDTATVAALIIGCWGDTTDEPQGSAARDALLAHADRFPGLRSLFFGEFLAEEAEVSWIWQCDVAPLLAGFPKLSELVVRGSEGLVFPRARHSALRGLAVQSGGLPREVTAGILASDLPELAHLELWLGVEYYGGTTTAEDLAPLLDGRVLPSLRALGLRNAADTDGLVRALAGAPLLGRLDVLDLSMGTLTDTGARTIVDTPALRGLRRLDLRHHYLSEEAGMADRVRAALTGVEVNLDGRMEPDDGEDEEFRYYPSVTE